VSIALVFVSWIPPDRLPATLLILMPGRVLNVCALMYTAMIVGLAGRYRTLWSRLLLVVLVAGLLAGDHSMLWEWLQQKLGLYITSPVKPLWIVTLASIGLVIGAAFEKWRRDKKVAPYTAGVVRTAAMGLLAATAVLMLGFA